MSCTLSTSITAILQREESSYEGAVLGEAAERRVERSNKRRQVDGQQVSALYFHRQAVYREPDVKKKKK